METIDIYEMRYKLILRLGDIPDGKYITKPTGTKKYKVKHSVPLYYDMGLKQGVVLPELEELSFLSSMDGIRICSKDKLMAVHFKTVTELQDFIEPLVEDEDNDR